MLNLLNAEFYKLFHSRYFWGIVAFNLFLSSVLLLDSIGETSSLFFASLYNVPILYFLAIVFSALFVGNDFGQRTLQSYINAGHNRGQILLAKLAAYQIACMTILALPLLVHGLIGGLCFKENFVSISGNLYTVLLVVVSLFAMCLLPFFFAFLFRDIGKTLAVPMVLFFLMIFLMNGDQALSISRMLPMGQLRLIALQQFTPSMAHLFQDFFILSNLSIITYSAAARKKLKHIVELGYGNFPICIAKTQYSFSTDPKIYGAVDNFEFHVQDIVMNAGAEMLVVIAGEIMRMPGLPKEPQALHIDIVNGEIEGLS